jgi:hypothetical protein
MSQKGCVFFWQIKFLENATDNKYNAKLSGCIIRFFISAEGTILAW